MASTGSIPVVALPANRHNPGARHSHSVPRAYPEIVRAPAFIALRCVILRTCFTDRNGDRARPRVLRVVQRVGQCFGPRKRVAAGARECCEPQVPGGRNLRSAKRVAAPESAARARLIRCPCAGTFRPVARGRPRRRSRAWPGRLQVSGSGRAAPARAGIQEKDLALGAGLETPVPNALSLGGRAAPSAAGPHQPSTRERSS